MRGWHSDHDGDVVLLLPGSAPQEVGADAHANISDETEARATLCAGRPLTGWGSVRTAHRHARQCTDAMERLGAVGGHATTDDVGALGPLLAGGIGVELFVEHNLRDILVYDRQRGTSLLDTLDEFLANGMNLTSTATALYIHPNTVSRRLDRIDRLIGSGWRGADRVLELRLALRVLHLLRKSPSSWSASVPEPRTKSVKRG